MSDVLRLFPALIRDGSAQVRRMAVEMLCACGPGEAEPMLVRAMEDPEPEVWQAAAAVLLNRQPWLILSPHAAREVPAGVLATDYGKAWRAVEKGLGSRAMQSNDWPSPEILHRWKGLPGALPDIVNALNAAGKHEKALEAAFTSSVDETSKQILLSPTYDCNLSCRYCYAKGWQKLFPTEMSLASFDALMAWCRKEGVGRLLLAGGEPSCHSGFGELLRRIAENGMTVQMTSNMMYGPRVRAAIDSRHIEDLVAHYDQGLLDDDARHQTFMANMDAALAKGVNVVIRYTLTDQSRAAEWDRLIALATRTRDRTLNYAFAFRNFLGNNLQAHYDLDDQNGKFFKKLDAFISRCDSGGIAPYLCKPIPLCTFPPKDLVRYLHNGLLRNACTIHLSGFTRNITVNPDLSILPCNALLMKGPRITSFTGLAEIGRYYEPAVRELMCHPYHESCERCLLFYRGFCFGPCLAEKHSLRKGEKSVLPRDGR